jgi:tetratricopeptide (TPR) repeat protein
VRDKFVEKLGPDHPHTLTMLNGLANAYLATGKLSEAIRLHEQTLEKRKTKLGPQHPSTLENMNDLAVAYWLARKLDRSVPLLEEALRLQKEKRGPDHLRTLHAAFNLAVNYLDAGRLGGAVTLLDEYLPRARSVLPPGAPSRNLGLSAGAETYTRAGRHDKAEPLLRELADLAKQGPGQQLRPYQIQLALLGTNLLQQKKYSEAEKVLRECLAIREKSEPDAWTTFNSRSQLGGTLLGRKKYAEAEPLLLQGYEGMKRRQDKIPPEGKVRLFEAMERLVQLYDAWGKKDQADHWRKELEAARARPQK